MLKIDLTLLQLIYYVHLNKIYVIVLTVANETPNTRVFLLDFKVGNI